MAFYVILKFPWNQSKFCGHLYANGALNTDKIHSYTFKIYCLALQGKGTVNINYSWDKPFNVSPKLPSI